MTSARREQLIKALQDKEYRELYAEEHIKTGLAFQIRALREARNWTQAELGSESGKSQVVISQLEDPDYGKFQLRTLLTLAAAFDVALIARFAPYSELLDRTLNLAPEHLAPPSFEAQFQHAFANTTIRIVDSNVGLAYEGDSGASSSDFKIPMEAEERENVYAKTA